MVLYANVMKQLKTKYWMQIEVSCIFVEYLEHEIYEKCAYIYFINIISAFQIVQNTRFM